MWANTWGSMCVCVCISHIHTKKMYIHECEHTSLFWSNCMYDRVIPISCKTSFLHRSCKLQSLKVTINYYFFFLILKKKNFNCVVLLLVWFFFSFSFGKQISSINSLCRLLQQWIKGKAWSVAAPVLLQVLPLFPDSGPYSVRSSM